MSLEVAAQKKLKDFLLDVQFRSDGGTMGILGASGCGKSMTLKSIAGIEAPDSGQISVSGRVLFDSARKINLRPQNRKLGYLFQNHALFPHMTVRDNIACALGGASAAERKKRIAALLEKFQIAELAARYPGQLSGGQQQRVALARILAGQPDALLLDEPFSALDFHLREQMQLALMNYLGDYPGDVIIVTHSHNEVYHLCERLMLMENGRCIASGKTGELFRRPKLLAAARLTGCKNFSSIVPLGKNKVLAADWGVELTVAGDLTGGIDCIGVHAHDFQPAQPGQDCNTFAVQAKERIESPFDWNMILTPKNTESTIWWKTAKEATDGQPPDFLTVAADKVLLLKSTTPSRAAGTGEII